MKTLWQRFYRDEEGITALETAIILIAFVVVASVFAFTILSSGTSSTQQAKDAIAGGLAQVSGSLQIKGSVIATEDAVTPDQIGEILFTVSTVTGGGSVDLTAPGAEGDNTLVIDYRDVATYETDVPWTVEFVGDNNDDTMLDDRELAKITIDLTAVGDTGVVLGPNTTFTVELKPTTGGTVPIQRTTPPSIDAVMDLG